MELFEELTIVALQENKSGEFPTWLLDEVLAIAGQPERYAGRSGLVRTLVDQIRHFDPYAGAGCFSTSVGVEAIRATLRRIGQGHQAGVSEEGER